MAFNVARFTTFNAGQTGAGVFAMYDGSGTGAGADATTAIDDDDYFDHDVVKDAIALASDGRTTGAGLMCMVHGNNAIEVRVLWNDSGTVKARPGAAWTID